MKSRLVLLLLAAHAGAALAQYKCTAANGAITFQQTPCSGSQSEQKLNVVPNGHPPPTAASGARAPQGAAPVGNAGPSVDKRMLANYERQNQRVGLEQALKQARAEKDQRAVERSQAVAAAQKQFGGYPDNAAALRGALAAIDDRYRTLAEIDDGRIAAAQAELDRWDRAQASGTSAPAGN